jgi:deoxyribonuclease-4
MWLIGAHVSIAGEISQSFDRAKALNCTAFQIFTRNPRGWSSKKLDEKEILNFHKKFEETGLFPVAHMPYLPNLASPNKEIYDKSVKILSEELTKCHILKIQYLVTHMGSHMGTSEEEGIRRVAEACNIALKSSEGNTMLLLENTAGQKNSVGHTLGHLRRCLDLIEDQSRVGVCFDTCHGFAAGYDIRTQDAVEHLLKDFEGTIGIERLKVIHVNDSKGALNSHLDRHEHIGRGQIGLNGFKALMSFKQVRKLPLIIETPYESEKDYMRDIEILWSIAKEQV